jgi:hypothetical protein
LSDPNDVKQRSRGQKIGDIGEAYVRAWVEEAGGWIARAQEKDFGVDLELELDERGVRGELIKVQVRTHEKAEGEAFVTVPVERKLLSWNRSCVCAANRPRSARPLVPLSPITRRETLASAPASGMIASQRECVFASTDSR